MFSNELLAETVQLIFPRQHSTFGFICRMYDIEHSRNGRDSLANDGAFDGTF
jgi:hypothetical protein